MLARIFASMVLLGATVTPSVAQRFRGYTGRLRAIGFPNRLSCDPDGEVGGNRIEDATRRGIDIDPIAPRADQYNVINIGPCKDKPFPLHQGSILQDTNVQIYFAWDSETKTAFYCTNSNPQDNCAEFFPRDQCTWKK